MKRESDTKPSAFENIVKAAVSIPKDKLAKLKQQDQQRERRKWCRREPAE